MTDPELKEHAPEADDIDEEQERLWAEEQATNSPARAYDVAVITLDTALHATREALRARRAERDALHGEIRELVREEALLASMMRVAKKKEDDETTEVET